MILVGIDDRPSARDALVLGRWLAAARSQELLPAWVHPYERLPSLLEVGPEQDQLRQAIEAMAGDVRSTLPDELRGELRLVSGSSAAEALEQLATRENASLIVLGSSERSGIGRIVPGSTARRLLSGSTVPVAIAPRDYQHEPDREPVIGVGFDGGPEAELALDWAAGLARSVGGRLRLVAVHQPIAFADVSVGALPTESVGQALRRQLREEVEKAVTRVASVGLETAFRSGDPAGELAEASADMDLLVLGSRGYGPVRSVLLGSVSEATVAASTTPVVVVPRGQRTASD